MMDNDRLLAQTLKTSKTLHENEKHSWYSGIVFILDELRINLDMSIEEIKNRLIRYRYRYRYFIDKHRVHSHSNILNMIKKNVKRQGL